MIGMYIPLIEGVDITDKTLTADALLTQRKLARYLVEQRAARHLFTGKDKQPIFLADLRLGFQGRGQPDYCEPFTLAHGRLESRSIYDPTQRLFGISPRQASLCHPMPNHCEKTRKVSTEIVYGITSRGPESADPA
jgi:hypothetical protein